MKKTLQEIAGWLNVGEVPFGDAVCTGVSIDTRTLKEGDLFIPFRGEAVNGHKFVEQAFEKGAAASFWLKDEPNPPKDKPILFVDNAEEALQEMARKYRAELNAKFIGITGSNGKTSTKDMIASMLSPYFKVQKTLGNYNNELGLPLTILSLDEDVEVAVLEMGMSGFGEIEFLSTLARPHIAVITNIGEAHMEALGSRAGIAKAKFEIVKGLKAKDDDKSTSHELVEIDLNEQGALIYDGDEPLLCKLIDENGPNINYFSVGLKNDTAISAHNIETVAQGSRFTAEGVVPGDFFIPVLGEHQVKNALNAIVVGYLLDLSKEQIQKGFEQVSLTNMRMQLVPTETCLFINDAYNAAPTSMKAAIEFVQSTSIKEDKWLVLGDMLELGNLEKEFHEGLHEVINPSKISNVCLFGVRMKWLYDKLKYQFSEDRLCYTENDYEKIVQFIKEKATKESIVLLKGSRGMKLETILKSFTE